MLTTYVHQKYRACFEHKHAELKNNRKGKTMVTEVPRWWYTSNYTVIKL